MKLKIILFILAVSLLVGFAFQLEGVTNFTGVQIKATSLATATPLLEVYNQGVSQSFVVRDSGGTPEVVINSNGTLNANALQLGGVSQSGPIKFGASSNVVSGTLISHGFSTTPTSIILSPFYSASSGAFTQTLSISATNATSFTVNISPGDVTTITTVYWMAGQ